MPGSAARVIQVRRTGKGCLSYLIGADGAAAVIDPALPPDVYRDLAQRQGWRITQVLETHLHADHLSRARALAEQSGAALLLPAGHRVAAPFTALADGATIAIGAARLTVLHTPGHTPESSCYLLDDAVLFTGDTLFLAAVGRPDLHTSTAGARVQAQALYRSLQRLLRLDPGILVLPGHTSEPIAFNGQPVAASLGEIRARLALLREPEATFVDTILARIPPTPPNHEQIIALNEAGELPAGDPTSVGGRRESLCGRLIQDRSSAHQRVQQQGSVTSEMQTTQRGFDRAPIVDHDDHDAPSVFTPENLLREARRQKGIAPGSVPNICVLDPDGDLVDYLRAHGRAQQDATWACYHTELYTFGHEGLDYGIVGRVVGAPFAVLVAEELFASGCRLIISITSAGQITPVGAPPYFVLIERALRDEGTSYHYLPPAPYSELRPEIGEVIRAGWDHTRVSLYAGASWTTDAPFRETEADACALPVRGHPRGGDGGGSPLCAGDREARGHHLLRARHQSNGPERSRL